MPKQKTIAELNAEKEKIEQQLTQEQHKKQRLENRIAYYERGDRTKRAHNLIVRSADMGKIISIDEINRAVMEGKDDLVFELCKVFDHESYFDPIFDPPESFLQECEAYWNRRSPFCKTVERKIGNTWYTIETVCDGTEPLTAKVKRLIFSDREVAC